MKSRIGVNGRHFLNWLEAQMQGLDYAGITRRPRASGQKESPAAEPGFREKLGSLSAIEVS